MRLKTTHSTANERIIALVNTGYSVLNNIREDYDQKKQKNSYSKVTDIPNYETEINSWADIVVLALNEIFPTELEKNTFLNPDISFGAISGDYEFQSLIRNFIFYIKGLEAIRTKSIDNKYVFLCKHISI